MKKFNHKFTNNGLTEFNDHVWSRLFDLTDKGYTLKIQPSSKTEYWRFGIRLSKLKTIKFFHPSGRYTIPEFNNYIDVHVGVGDWSSTFWLSPNKLYLAQYNLLDQSKHILGISNNYKGFAKVEWNVKYLKNEKSLYLSYKADGVDNFYNSYPLDEDFKYFKVFAWADGTEFEIDCNLEISELEDTSEKINEEKFIESARPFFITDKVAPAIGVVQLAESIGELIVKLQDEKGNMFGIFGHWGRGKTYLWQEIWKYLGKKDKENDILFVKSEYHAWKYQDTPASWAYLYETLADSYFKDNRKKKESFMHPAYWLFIFIKNEIAGVDIVKRIISSQAVKALSLNKIVKLIFLNSTRKGIWPIVFFFSSLIFFITWLFLIPFATKIGWGLYIFSSFGTIILLKWIYLYLVYKPKAINILSAYSEKVSFQKYLGLQAEIQKEIVSLLKTWIRKKELNSKKILLFVDDIDRCSEDRIIQVVDSLKVMLEDEEISKRMIIIVALDERVLKMAINLKYKELVKDVTTADKQLNSILPKLTKEYIEKLFLSSVKLGHLSKNEVGEIFASITDGRVSPNTILTTQGEAGSISELDEGMEETTTPKSQNSDSPEQNAANNTVIIEDESYDIGRYEFEILNTAVRLLKDPTPRAIRIYFYRYMLAKNIKKFLFANDSILNDVWHSNNKNKLALAELIVYYSNELNSDKIQEDCIKASSNDGNLITIEPFENKFTLNTSLYLELLKIIEMVVPY